MNPLQKALEALINSSDATEFSLLINTLFLQITKEHAKPIELDVLRNKINSKLSEMATQLPAHRLKAYAHALDYFDNFMENPFQNETALEQQELETKQRLDSTDKDAPSNLKEEAARAEKEYMALLAHKYRIFNAAAALKEKIIPEVISVEINNECDPCLKDLKNEINEEWESVESNYSEWELKYRKNGDIVLTPKYGLGGDYLKKDGSLNPTVVLKDYPQLQHVYELCEQHNAVNAIKQAATSTQHRNAATRLNAINLVVKSKQSDVKIQPRSRIDEFFRNINDSCLKRFLVKSDASIRTLGFSQNDLAPRNASKKPSRSYLIPQLPSDDAQSVYLPSIIVVFGPETRKIP